MSQSGLAGSSFLRVAADQLSGFYQPGNNLPTADYVGITAFRFPRLRQVPSTMRFRQLFGGTRAIQWWPLLSIQFRLIYGCEPAIQMCIATVNKYNLPGRVT